MKNSIALIGGLVLTLGAFGPAFAQNSAVPNPGGANSSATTSGAGTWQNDQTEEDQHQNQNSAPEQQNSSAPSAATGVSASSLSQQQSRIGQEIHRLDRNLSDAESYEAEGREDWMSGDTAGARRDFRIAEHILKMATGGGSFQPSYFGGNPQQQEQLVKKAIKQAESNGQDVSDAKQLLKKGQDALHSSDMAKASRHFRAAELALGIPVEVGYAEVWESEIPPGAQNSFAGNQNPAQEDQQHGTAQGSQPNSGNQQIASGESQNLRNDITRAAGQGKDVDDARFLLHEGEQALQNGNQEKAQRDFRAAENALSMNENSNYSDSTTQNPGAGK